jgi:hypothetical protein
VTLMIKLFRGAVLAYHHSSGFPARLVLAPAELAAFQECLAAHGLPPNLYYPEWERRRVVQPAASACSSCFDAAALDWVRRSPGSVVSHRALAHVGSRE